jgi:hypothetical protein
VQQELPEPSDQRVGASSAPGSIGVEARPLVAMHVYVDERGRTLSPHPGVRTASPERYLECAVVQAASLRLRDAACDVALVSNIVDPAKLGRRVSKLWAALGSLNVEIIASPLPIDPSSGYGPARPLRDALALASEGQPSGRRLWFPNADCVWRDPQAALRLSVEPDEVGCLVIDYPPDWSVGGPAQVGDTRRSLAATALRLGSTSAELVGGSESAPAWIGGDVLGATCETLAKLGEVYDELDARLRGEGTVPTTEQLLTLAGALERVSFRDLGKVFARIHTGARHRDAAARANGLAVWHLPGEKGLSFRRAANHVLAGRSQRLGAELADEHRAARRFNVATTRRSRQLRDYSWLAAQGVVAKLSRQ